MESVNEKHTANVRESESTVHFMHTHHLSCEPGDCTPRPGCAMHKQMSWLQYSQALTNGTMFILLNCHFELIYTHCSLASLCQSTVHTCSPPPLPEMMHSLACIHWHAFTDIHSHTRVPYADSHTAQVFQQWKPVTMGWQWSCINAPSQLSTGSCIYHHFHLGMTKARHELHLINLHGNLLFT